MPNSDSTAAQRPRWSTFLRRGVALPGLAAFWILLVPTGLFVGVCLLIAVFGAAFGVAVQDGASMEPESIGRALLYGALFAFAGVGYVVRRLRERVRWEGALAAGAAPFVPGAALVHWDERWDLPGLQAMFLAAFYCALGAVILGIALVLLARATRWAWVAAADRRLWAVIVGPGGLVGAVALFAVFVGLFAQIEEHPDDDQLMWQTPGLRGALGDIILFVADEARMTSRAARLAELAFPATSPLAWLPSVRSAYADTPTSGMHFCLETLAKRTPDGPVGHIDRAAKYLRNRAGIAFEDAMDEATDRALHVCTRPNFRDAVRDPDDIRAYYWVAVKRRRADLLERRARRPRARPLPDDGPPAPDLGRYLEARSCLNLVRQRLGGEEQALLKLCVENTSREIAERTAVSKSAADRDCRKLIDRVRTMISNSCL